MLLDVEVSVGVQAADRQQMRKEDTDGVGDKLRNKWDYMNTRISQTKKLIHTGTEENKDLELHQPHICWRRWTGQLRSPQHRRHGDPRPARPGLLTMPRNQALKVLTGISGSSVSGTTARTAGKGLVSASQSPSTSSSPMTRDKSTSSSMRWPLRMSDPAPSWVLWVSFPGRALTACGSGSSPSLPVFSGSIEAFLGPASAKLSVGDGAAWRGEVVERVGGRDHTLS